MHELKSSLPEIFTPTHLHTDAKAQSRDGGREAVRVLTAEDSILFHQHSIIYMIRHLPITAQTAHLNMCHEWLIIPIVWLLVADCRNPGQARVIMQARCIFRKLIRPFVPHVTGMGSNLLNLNLHLMVPEKTQAGSHLLPQVIIKT